MPEMAVFDGNRNTVTINLARHSSPEDVASTLVHEATHQNRFFSGNQLGTQFEEYLLLRNEFLYGAGRRPSLPERQIIWQKRKISILNCLLVVRPLEVSNEAFCYERLLKYGVATLC